MSNAMAVRWKAWSAQYAQRPKREKLIIAFAALALTWALVDALWLTPVTRELKLQTSALEKKEKELAQLDAQRQALQLAITAKAAEQQREMTQLRADFAAITGQLAEFEKALVPARRMPEFLRGLLPGAGVEVVALRTLEPTPLIIRAAAKEPAADAKAGKDAKPADNKPADNKPADNKPADNKPPSAGGGANLYRHGIEITLSGNYDALLAYLARLEGAPQKVLWGRLDLKTTKYPRNEMTLVLYTLSLDPSWLVV